MTKGGAADSSVGVWHVLARAGMHGILSIVNHCGDDALRIAIPIQVLLAGALILFTPLFSRASCDTAAVRAVAMQEDDLTCSVCYELPPGEVHQCQRGHFLCVSCCRDSHSPWSSTASTLPMRGGCIFLWMTVASISSERRTAPASETAACNRIWSSRRATSRLRCASSTASRCSAGDASLGARPERRVYGGRSVGSDVRAVRARELAGLVGRGEWLRRERGVNSCMIALHSSKKASVRRRLQAPVQPRTADSRSATAHANPAERGQPE